MAVTFLGVIGVLSDSHGQVRRTADAVALLRALGATVIVHCGDVGGAAVLDVLATVQARFVWGNTDERIADDDRYARAIGLTPPPRTPPLSFTHDGCEILVFHGHEREFADAQRRVAATDGASARFVLYGHTHVASVDELNGDWFVNPGALHRAATFTVATIEPAAARIRHYPVRPRGHNDALPQPLNLPL